MAHLEGWATGRSYGPRRQSTGKSAANGGASAIAALKWATALATPAG